MTNLKNGSMNGWNKCCTHRIVCLMNLQIFSISLSLSKYASNIKLIRGQRSENTLIMTWLVACSWAGDKLLAIKSSLSMFLATSELNDFLSSSESDVGASLFWLNANKAVAKGWQSFFISSVLVSFSGNSFTTTTRPRRMSSL